MFKKRSQVVITKKEKKGGGWLTKNLCFLVVCTLLLSSLSAPSVKANNFDLVISVDIGQSSFKVIEVKHSTNQVNFYEFDDAGMPILNGMQQVTFSPGDLLFNEKILKSTQAIIFNSTRVESNVAVSFLIYFANIEELKRVLQVVYYGPSDTDIVKIEHSVLDEPFTQNDDKGVFSVINVYTTTFSGYKYVPNHQNSLWLQSNTSGISNIHTEAPRQGSTKRHPVRYKLEGTTSNGRKIRITGEGEERKIEEFKDPPGEWKEVTDEDKIEEIMNEVANDLENGLGDYEGEAYDADGNPVDLIIWYKNADGTYTGIKMEMNGPDNWDLDGRTNIPRSVLCLMHYITCQGDDPNPRGAWFVGSRGENETNWYFEKYGWIEVETENGKELVWCQYSFGATPGGHKPKCLQDNERHVFFLPSSSVWPPSNP